MPYSIKALMTEYGLLGEPVILQAIKQFSIRGYEEDFFEWQKPEL
jgi:hypothetical protein